LSDNKRPLPFKLEVSISNRFNKILPTHNNLLLLFANLNQYQTVSKGLREAPEAGEKAERSRFSLNYRDIFRICVRIEQQIASNF
jgi:hypothetical protein